MRAKRRGEPWSAIVASRYVSARNRPSDVGHCGGLRADNTVDDGQLSRYVGKISTWSAVWIYPYTRYGFVPS